ncbi:hypothetical protein J0A67_18115 [Algoriphagus aestuariicola]|uniref:Uncharacterized protein n=1 Tax=Algoriphagus aestuariicola TaxID=1852016 RepID=A0ABS3BYJ8_9BACT|nr:hypothetical protein [Algoriphagus aestuariicola]MBN7802799.1 hypothetical protein [Algoriphagus aestuariicola]
MNEALENCPENISITISEIQDSRCPSDGNCIWAGMIMVDGELRVDGTVYDLQLSNIPQASGFQEEFSTSEYTIKLIDPIPFPNFSNLGKAADKRVILIVSKRST